MAANINVTFLILAVNDVYRPLADSKMEGLTGTYSQRTPARLAS